MLADFVFFSFEKPRRHKPSQCVQPTCTRLFRRNTPPLQSLLQFMKCTYKID